MLASNVLIIPTAAIKGSGANATVQLLVNGKTSTQSVVVGQQTQTESEITSGLSAGQNVVYTRTFTGRFPGSRANGQSGGQGLPPFGGQPNGAAPGGGGTNGAPPSGPRAAHERYMSGVEKRHRARSPERHEGVEDQ